MRTCDIAGCDRKHNSHGYCGMHYMRLRKYGDPGGLDALVAPRRTGHVDNNGYRTIYVVALKKRRLEHRVVMEQVLGRPLLPTENVHHINGDRLDNRAENLELWTTAQPSGQRVEDKVAWAVELLRQYRPELLTNETPETKEQHERQQPE